MAKVVVSFSGEFVGEYPLDRPASIVGRDATCDIQIDNLGVSRAHCQFVKRGDTYIVQDMNSANGTYVNGQKVGEHYLKDGDEVLIGKFLIKFDATGTAVPVAKAPEEKAPDVMGDALRTYIVDGAAIRERLAGMHEAETERSSVATQPEPGQAPRQVGLPDPPPGPRRAKDHALDFDPLKPRSKPGAPARRAPQAPAPTGGSGLLYFSLFLNLVLIGLVVVLLVMGKKARDAADRPTGDPTGVSAPEDVEGSSDAME
jgi:predicted component of type VI protein secretion system